MGQQAHPASLCMHISRKMYAFNVLLGILSLAQVEQASPYDRSQAHHYQPVVPTCCAERTGATLGRIVNHLRGGEASTRKTSSAASMPANAGTSGRDTGGVIMDEEDHGELSMDVFESGRALDAASVLAEWDDRYFAHSPAKSLTTANALISYLDLFRASSHSLACSFR